MLSGKFAMDVDLASVPPLTSRRRKDTLLLFRILKAVYPLEVPKVYDKVEENKNGTCRHLLLKGQSQSST